MPLQRCKYLAQHCKAAGGGWGWPGKRLKGYENSAVALGHGWGKGKGGTEPRRVGREGAAGGSIESRYERDGLKSRHAALVCGRLQLKKEDVRGR